MDWGNSAEIRRAASAEPEQCRPTAKGLPARTSQPRIMSQRQQPRLRSEIFPYPLASSFSSYATSPLHLSGRLSGTRPSAQTIELDQRVNDLPGLANSPVCF